MSVPVSMMDRGPVPGSVVITLDAQEAAVENTVVTYGTEDGSCKMCDATDEVLGWSAGKMVSGESASIYPVSASGTWKCRVASGSGDISFGDTLECAADGECSKAITGSGNTILGKALNDASASEVVIVMPIVATPSGVSS